MTPLLLSACLGVGAEPAFKDVQRQPPMVSEATSRVIVRDDRALAVWISETAKKCAEFGCVE